MDSPALLILFAVSAVLVFSGFRVIEEGERGVLFRLGRFAGVVEPGLRWVIPSTDKIVRVQLLEVLPDWRSLSASQLNERLEELARSGSLTSVGR